ncbi:MAG: thiol:disulfide interchange protein DsbA/DsbL, partial [Gammaproteobacteria bacterium]|nr:thiol:disulfide interchange protein DsbA/DsbL [Gammaproteobacteria bacterium]
ALLACLPLAPLTAAEFKENLNYFEIFPNYPGSEANKVEVVEFFMYSCPHCYDFEPHLNAWLANKPADVNFTKVPAVFNANARFFAEAYYSLEVMGVDHSIHEKIFAAIHDQQKRLFEAESLAEFLATQGVDANQFRQHLKSFAVQAKVNRAEELGKRYAIRAVPSMVVEGSWRTGQVGSFEEMLQLVDFLVAKGKKEKLATNP